MAWLRWDRGRQENGGRDYFKMLLARSARLRFDCYLLRYPTTSGLDEHVDPAPDGFEHHRVNIILRQPASGGLFLCDEAIIDRPRIKYFRPDLHPHRVTEGIGERLVLSFGWLRKAPGTGKNAET
ncbi:hypothetical protein ABNQ39_32640 [Azospirillum sp. A26]|uniref:hypothetical protein n=1 Tax=Azospirillum sp. A26 TaxID=3160607 RepID=UPI0036727564